MNITNALSTTFSTLSHYIASAPISDMASGLSEGVHGTQMMILLAGGAMLAGVVAGAMTQLYKQSTHQRQLHQSLRNLTTDIQAGRLCNGTPNERANQVVPKAIAAIFSKDKQARFLALGVFAALVDQGPIPFFLFYGAARAAVKHELAHSDSSPHAQARAHRVLDALIRERCPYAAAYLITLEDTPAAQRAEALTLFYEQFKPTETGYIFDEFHKPGLKAVQHELARLDPSNHESAYYILDELVRQRHAPAAAYLLSREDASAPQRAAALNALDHLVSQYKSPSYAFALAGARDELARPDTSNHDSAATLLLRIVQAADDDEVPLFSADAFEILAKYVLSRQDASAHQRTTALNMCEEVLRQGHVLSYPSVLAVIQRELAHLDTSNHHFAYRMLGRLVAKNQVFAYEPAFAAAEQFLTRKDASKEERATVLFLFQHLMERGHAPRYASILAAARRELDHPDTSNHCLACSLLEPLVRKGYFPAYQPALETAQHIAAHPSDYDRGMTYYIDLLDALVSQKYIPAYDPALTIALKEVQTRWNPYHDNCYRIFQNLLLNKHGLSRQLLAATGLWRGNTRPETVFSELFAPNPPPFVAVDFDHTDLQEFFAPPEPVLDDIADIADIQEFLALTEPVLDPAE